MSPGPCSGTFWTRALRTGSTEGQGLCGGAGSVTTQSSILPACQGKPGCRQSTHVQVPPFIWGVVSQAI